VVVCSRPRVSLAHRVAEDQPFQSLHGCLSISLGIPQDLSFYRLDQRIAHFEALMLHLDLRDITLVVHDWGGPVGLGFATRHPERIKRLVLLNTWAFAPWPGGSFPRLTCTPSWGLPGNWCYSMPTNQTAVVGSETVVAGRSIPLPFLY
jgi:pimeloyl-ACP methyl ester carboxylesterase